MIYRERPEPPEAFRAAREELNDIQARIDGLFLNRSEKEYAQVSISSHLKEFERMEYDLRNAMLEAFWPQDPEGACACIFCEQVFPPDALAVTRFRPLEDAWDGANKPSKPHYAWLAYEWKNLFLVCEACRHTHENYFPAAQRGEFGSTIEELRQTERAQILDPTHEDPAYSFYVNFEGRIELFPDDLQFAETIQKYDLNRRSLMRDRLAVIQEFSEFIVSPLQDDVNYGKDPEEITAQLSSWFEQPHVGLRRQLIMGHALVLGALEFAEFFANSHEFAAKPYLTRSSHLLLVHKTILSEHGEAPPETAPPEPEMAAASSAIDLGPPVTRDSILSAGISSITLTNFKNIASLEINLEASASSSRPWFFLLGENGSGKSSILQSILLTLADREYLSSLGLKLGGFVRRIEPGITADHAEVRIVSREKEEARLWFDHENFYTNVEPLPASSFSDRKLLAYGSTRLSASVDGITSEPFDHSARLRNFFHPLNGLVDAQDYLVDLWDEKTNHDDDTFDQVATVLKDVLSLRRSIFEAEDKGTIEVHDGDVWLSRPGQPLQSLSTLSDGYKVLIALVCDIFKSIGTRYEGATVFIDELGTHLHPRWKMRIVESLKSGFSNVDFFVTSHEPLCLRGLREGEVHIVTSDAGEVDVQSDLPDPSKFRVDQLLTSPFFGLSSAIDPQAEKLFAEYYALLRKEGESALNSVEQARRDELNLQISEYNLMGNNLREELAYYAVDTLLARKPKSTGGLKKETVLRVQELWDKYLEES